LQPLQSQLLLAFLQLSSAQSAFFISLPWSLGQENFKTLRVVEIFLEHAKLLPDNKKKTKQSNAIMLLCILKFFNPTKV